MPINQKKRVLVINQFAANKGDRAVLYALVRELLKHSSQVTVSTSDPELWSQYDFYSENGVEFVPWGWSFWEGGSRLGRLLFRKWAELKYAIAKSIVFGGRKGRYIPMRVLCDGSFSKALSRSDLVISTGGHHITTILVPNARTGQMFDLSMAVIAKKDLVLWSQSIGPLVFTERSDEMLTKKILRHASSICVRDEHSIRETQRFLEDDGSIRKTYESVFLLAGRTDYVKPSKREKKFGVSIYSTKLRSRAEREYYVDVIASFSNFMHRSGYSIEFFPMEMKGNLADDREMIKSIVDRLDSSVTWSVHDEDLETLSHLEKLATCQIFLGHKTHSVIFGLATGTPLIAIAYHSKTEAFMGQFGLESHCVTDSNLSVDALKHIYTSVALDLDGLGDLQISTSQRFSSKIRQDLEELLTV